MTQARAKRIPWLGALVVVSLAATAFMALVAAPADAEQGDAQRLMYLHVPTAWLAYLAFTVTEVKGEGVQWVQVCNLRLQISGQGQVREQVDGQDHDRAHVDPELVPPVRQPAHARR